MAARRASSVFLNVPYDSGYERNFVALISSLVALGRAPRCVLEIAESGQGRLARIMKLMAQCPVSIHDLSRVGSPVRFNMPFELGLAYAIRSRRKGRQHILILERVPFRLQRTLSDWSGRDPVIHGGKPWGVIVAVLDALGTPTRNPDPTMVYGQWRELWRGAMRLRDDRKQRTIFQRSTYLRLVAAALEIARRDRLVLP